MSKHLTDKTRALVSALYDGTISGRISWQIGEYSNTIDCVIGDHYIQLSQFNDGNSDDVDYVLFIKDKSGNVKDRIDDENLSAKPSSLMEASSAASSAQGYLREVKLERLYFEGRRRALGADETIDEILGNLGVRP